MFNGNKGQARKVSHLRGRLGFSQFYVVNPIRVSARTMLVIWLDHIQIKNIFSNDITIDIEIVGICRATIVYGYCNDNTRLVEFERIINSKLKADHP